MTVLRCTRLFGIAHNVKRRKFQTKTTSGLTHTPVLLREVLSYFGDSDLHTFLDCTVGGGGHSSEIIRRHPVSTLEPPSSLLESLQELECVVGVDMDSIALTQARTALDPFIDQRPGLHLHLLEGNYKYIG